MGLLCTSQADHCSLPNQQAAFRYSVDSFFEGMNLSLVLEIVEVFIVPRF
jgi:hypothetical protein